MYTIVYMEDLYTVKQVSILLKVHHLTIRRYINEGKLKAIRVAGTVRISQQDLNAFTQSYTPHQKAIKAQPQTSLTSPFTPEDPLFRLKGRGISIDNLSK